jgi:large subunit ribosomal protein L9
MQVILKQEVDRLGFPGDVVDVKDGYARNYLLPRGYAVKATAGALRARSRDQQVRDKKETAQKKQFEDVAAALDGQVLVVPKRAGGAGKLYGSVTVHDIEAAIQKKLGIEVERRRLVLSESIKMLGEHSRTFRIAAGVDATLTVKVVREGEEEEAEEEEPEPEAEGETDETGSELEE